MRIKKSDADVGILGYGEVGRAIAKFYKHPKIKDKRENNDLSGVKFLHICIPYSKDFVKIVKEEIYQSRPKLTIIHSTVPVGTTREIGGAIVHSPVRGIHPYLYKHIKTFLKYIGADYVGDGLLCRAHFNELGIPCIVIGDSGTTELAKLLDTTYYGLCIAWHGEAEKMCRSLGLDFDNVMTLYNTTYNEGYSKVGKKNVIRPVLTPPVDDKIGGHCIIQNAELLKKDFNSLAIDLVLKYK